MPRRKPKSANSWSMYPDLHDEVAAELGKNNLVFGFYNNDDDSSAAEDYDTNIMGRFQCYNRSCSTNGWSSKKIAISIRMYSGNRYNARVYHQRCKQCNSLSRPHLDEESYVDRVSYRLKKWKGIDMEPPPYGGESNGPHENHLCEGCKNGHCSQGYW